MISIIVPVYNTEPYLCRCLDSIRNQTCRHFEVLLVNDGSTDQSGEICDRYARQDERFRAFHIPNGGVSNARNHALAQMRGSYAAFVDSDDWMEPDMLEKLRALVDGSGRDAAMCAAFDVYGDQKRPARMCSGLPDEASGREILRVFLGRSGTLWNKLIGRECIGDTRFRRELHYGEDMFFLRDIAPNVEKLRIIDVPLYNYRRDREGNVVSSGLSSRYGDLLTMTEMAVDALWAEGCYFEAVSRIRLCAGRLLKASACAPMQESAAYRTRCRQLLKRGNARAKCLLQDRVVNRNSRVVRYLEYKACAFSPELVVLLYKLRRMLFR